MAHDAFLSRSVSAANFLSASFIPTLNSAGGQTQRREEVGEKEDALSEQGKYRRKFLISDAILYQN